MLTPLKNIAIGCLTALAAMAAQAADPAAAATDPYPPVKFDMPSQAEFVKHLNLTPGRHDGVKSAEEAKKMLADVYEEKVTQHAMTRHYDKGMTCVTCHDQQKIGTPDWMTAVTQPAIKQNCTDCHKTQAKVWQHADTHMKQQCIACHMPNMPAPKDFTGGEELSNDTAHNYYNAVRRAHLYKINVSPTATTFVKKVVKGKDGFDHNVWTYATDDKGHGFVDVAWSCGRAAPGDYTLYGEDGRGCHGSANSQLEKGLVYLNQAQIYSEILKWQTPVKNGYKAINDGLKRLTKLLEVTKLSPADQTEVRLMMDKASEIADEVRTDGSWGVHAFRYLRDRVNAGQGYIAKAQQIIDNGGYKKADK